MPISPQQQAQRLAAKIAQEVTRAAGMGVNAARIFLVSRIKEELSVPAVPRYRLPDGTYYCPTRATAGAPPRKLSGRLRGSITSYMQSSTVAVIGANARAKPTPRYPGGFNYPRYHELHTANYIMSGRHQFIQPTVEKNRVQLRTIIGQNFRLMG